MEKKDQTADVDVKIPADADAKATAIAITAAATVSLDLEIIHAVAFSGSSSFPACAAMADAAMATEIMADTTADVTMDVIPAGFLLFSYFYVATTAAAN